MQNTYESTERFDVAIALRALHLQCSETAPLAITCSRYTYTFKNKSWKIIAKNSLKIISAPLTYFAFASTARETGKKIYGRAVAFFYMSKP